MALIHDHYYAVIIATIFPHVGNEKCLDTADSVDSTHYCAQVLEE